MPTFVVARSTEQFKNILYKSVKPARLALPNQEVIMFDIISTSILGIVVLCLMVITLGLQIQVRSLNEKIDELIRRSQGGSK